MIDCLVSSGNCLAEIPDNDNRVKTLCENIKKNNHGVGDRRRPKQEGIFTVAGSADLLR
jgi:hypothetical protein